VGHGKEFAEFANPCQELFAIFDKIIYAVSMDDFLPRVQRWLSTIRAKDLRYLAQTTGVAQGTLHNLKYGRTTRPTLPTVERLQKFLDAHGL
jgi:hypothetical protein